MIITSRRITFLSLFLAACSSSSRSGPSAPIPETIEPASPIVEPGRTSWTIPARTLEQRFISITTGSIETTTPQGVRRDTVTVNASFITTLTRGSPATYSARLETLSSREAPSGLPLTFSGRIEPGRITVEPAINPTGCSNSAYSVMPAILRSMVTVPAQLSRGMTWSDSTTSSVCSGPIPVTLVSIRAYRVVGEVRLSGQQALLFEQQLTTRFNGEGSQDQHRIKISGEGSGKGQIHIDLATGALINSVLDHTSAITVTASGRDQRFTQVSRELIQRSQ